MPQFLLLLHDEDADHANLSEEELGQLFQSFVSWTEDLHRRGKLRGVERLTPPAGSATVRKRGDRIVVDGPYTEGKEAILGLYVIEAADYDEAARIAHEVPSIAIGGSVEVREIGEFPKPGGR